MPFRNNTRNFRIAIVAVTLFLIFDFIALALNFWLSWKIEQNAVEINLAGRQRMLSQRMVKSLLQLQDAREFGRDTSDDLAELETTFDLFDSTLKGFSEGSFTRGGTNQTIFLKPAKGDAARLVAKANAIWLPYRKLVADVIQADPSRLDATLMTAAIYAHKHNLELLDLMNQLTTELERLTQHESSQIRLYQGSAFVIAMLNFVGALFISMRRIRFIAKSHGLLDDIINKISACVLVLSKSKTVMKANLTAEQLFGYGKGELIGQHVDTLLQVQEGRLVAHRKDGTTFPVSRERDRVMMDGEVLYIDTVIDITRQRMTEEHLTSLAYHDLLTGLPNRLLFDDRLHLELTHAQRNSQPLAVLFLDLDNFKPINDTYGHGVGDLLLQEVTARLKHCLRDVDTVSRRGGDEFTIILSEIGTHENCERITKIILAQLGKPMQINELQISIGASIGIAMFPEDGGTGPELVAKADEAMYRAKQTGRNTYYFYSEQREKTNRSG